MKYLIMLFVLSVSIVPNNGSFVSICNFYSGVGVGFGGRECGNSMENACKEFTGALGDIVSVIEFNYHDIFTMFANFYGFAKFLWSTFMNCQIFDNTALFFEHFTDIMASYSQRFSTMKEDISLASGYMRNGEYYDFGYYLGDLWAQLFKYHV